MARSIEDQLELEAHMIDCGVSRFGNITTSAESSGQGSTTTYARTLTRSLIVPLSDAITQYKADTAAGIGAKYRKLLVNVPSEKAAFFTLKAVFNHFMKEETVQTLAISIGWYIEDELKFSMFQQEHTEYYNAIMQDFKRKGTTNYRWMHRVLTFKANERQVKWTSWTPEERLRIGTAMLDLLIKNTDLVKRKTITLGKRKRKVVLVPTQEALAWVKKHMDAMSVLNPDRTPCVIAPDPWVSYDQGGYYSPRLRMRSPLVKTRDREQIKLLESADLSSVMSAVNALQAVPWGVNTRVLDVMMHVWNESLGIGLPASNPIIIPDSPVKRSISKSDMTDVQLAAFLGWKKEASALHSMEKERVSKCFQVSRVLRMANTYKEYDKFWYVYQCDFRGRMYAATAGFSPQGPDFSKALLHFAEGKELGNTGMYWLKVHGANTYGEDKVSYEERVKWIDLRAEDILRSASDPLRNTDFWANADKPWQFLAFCFEYSAAMREGETFKSHLPIALDGSCNGLQNFSAMLRDEIGGAATNLTIQDKPADIYAEVAKVLTQKVKESTHEFAEGWVRYIAAYGDSGVISRKLVKRPVMTLPYGSTKQSCSDYVFRSLLEQAPEFFPSTDRYMRAVWLTQHLWTSINEVVIAAREGMDWLQEAAGLLAKENHSMLWCTPVGFPVYQGTKKFVSRRVDTQLGGRVQFVFGKESEDLHVKKQKQGISPNFVHSMDACHLMLSLNWGVEEGLQAFSCIHDDFGTYAADTDVWHRIIRSAFVELYSTDVLGDFKDNQESLYDVSLPKLPKKGRLRIQDVLQAQYFFG